jgi:hypothetical protein
MNMADNMHQSITVSPNAIQNLGDKGEDERQRTQIQYEEHLSLSI